MEIFEGIGSKHLIWGEIKIVSQRLRFGIFKVQELIVLDVEDVLDQS